MSYLLISELKESDWDDCVKTIALFSDVLGNRTHAGYNDAIRSQAEAAAIIGKTYGKDFLIEYSRGLQLEYNSGPAAAFDKMAKGGILIDATSFSSDIKHLNSANLAGKDISQIQMKSISGEALKPEALERAAIIAAEKVVQKDIAQKLILDSDALKLAAALSSSVNINSDLNAILQNEKKIQLAIKNLELDFNALKNRPAIKLKPTPEFQLKIQAKIIREKSFKFYESVEGKQLIRSSQSKMSWVSARAAGREKPDEYDREYSKLTIEKLKASHAYGRGRFAVEIIKTKARSEARELKSNPDFMKKKASEVFHPKSSAVKVSRAKASKYSKTQDDVINAALEKERLKKQKENSKKIK